MSISEIQFWLGRVNEEFIKRINDTLNDVMVKNYQILNFHQMRKEVQEEVINQLLGDMELLGWNKEVKELKEGLE